MKSVLRSEQGIALALALIMLVVMSLIGIMTLNTTDTELNIASNYGRAQSSTSAATSIVSYAQTTGKIYNDIGTGTIELADGDPATQTIYEQDLAGLGKNVRIREGIQNADGTFEPHTEWNRVEFLGSGPLPPGSGTQANDEDGGFTGRYYLISTAVEESGGAVARVESQLVRVVPK